MKPFDQPYKEQLLQSYPADIVEQITGTPQQAPLPYQPGQTVPYVYVRGHNVPEDRDPVLFVPGFGEGIINKASFAAELAMQGADVILPGQNRHGIARNAYGTRSAVYTQALNYEAVLDHAVGRDRPADIVGHSYGGLVTSAMVRRAYGRFADSDVVLLATAGAIENETIPRLGRRWLQMIKSEINPDRPCEFPDPRGVTGTASLKTVLKNPRRSFMEVRDMTRLYLDPWLSSRVGSLTIMSYAEDAMFPADRQATILGEMVDSGATWLTPVSPERVPKEMNYAGEGAVHDDEQFNPARVAEAVMQVLRPRIARHRA